jgi:SNF2 family DNA or RNA helicase
MVKLYKLRNWKVPDDGPVPFKWPTRLRTTLWDIIRDRDSGIVLEPKQYQLQMAHHLSRMPRILDGDSVGLGKSLEAIIAACWLADRLSRIKVIVITTKSVAGQFADEFLRFSTMRPVVMQDKHGKLKSYPARFAQLREFLEGDDHDVLVCKYSSMIGKRKKVEGPFDEDGFPTYQGKERVASEVREFLKILKPHGKDVVLVLDECQKFKSIGSNTRAMVQILSRPCRQVWGLTATVIRNGIDEMYSVASAIGITPFGSMSEFEEEFCIFRNIFVGKGRQKRVLQGYRNIPKFKAGMRPFFFGRSQRQVKEKLPRLTTRIIPIDLSEEQTKLLLEDIPSGAFQLPPSVIKLHGEIITRDRDPENEMTLLSVFQLVANHPGLLDPTDKKRFLTRSLSPKEEALLDLLDGDLRGEKVVVFTKSRTWIDRLEHLTKEGAFTERKFLRITGAESDKTRAQAMRLFQDPEGDHDLIVINAAATEGVNLQAAGHLICLDVPWSFGDLLQLVGRILRLKSNFDMCMLHILVARGSVDEYAISTLQSKGKVFATLLGDSHTAGLLNDQEIFDLTSGMEQSAKDSEFLDMMKAHVKDVGLGTFLKGEQLADAQSDDNRKMSFEDGAKKKKVHSVIPDDFDALQNRWGM